MGANIPLPALDVRPVQQPNVLGQYGQLLSLRSLMGQQQMQQQGIQAGALENQQRQMDVQDQQNMRTLAPQFLKKDDSGKATGFDADGYYGALMGAGVSPQKIAAMQKAQNDAVLSKAQAGKAALDLEDSKNDQAYQILEGVRSQAKAPNADPAAVQGAYQSAMPRLQQLGIDTSKYPPQYPGDAGLSSFEVGLGVHKQIIADAKTQADTAQAAAKAGQAQQETTNLQAALPKIQAESSVAPQMAQLGVTQRQTEISKNRAQTGEALATTTKTKAETENLGQQPIFAVDPATNERVMTTRPEAQAKGYTNPVAVKEGDVAKETDARAMINDVQLNKSRYLSAMQRVYAEPMTTAQQTALTSLAPEKLGVDFGSLFKLELPDVMQKVANASAFSVLTPAQKQAVVGYYSTLASVPAAQKALTNIGRSNKEMMDLELRTIPTPLMDQGTFQTMLDRFQGNIEQTSRKTVRMPGMPSTDQIRETYEGAPKNQGPPSSMGVGSGSLSSLLSQLQSR